MIAHKKGHFRHVCLRSRCKVQDSRGSELPRFEVVPETYTPVAVSADPPVHAIGAGFKTVVERDPGEPVPNAVVRGHFRYVVDFEIQRSAQCSQAVVPFPEPDAVQGVDALAHVGNDDERASHGDQTFWHWFSMPIISFEGCDRSGKTTQAKRLFLSLKDRGVDARLWRFPDVTTDVGRVILRHLNGTKPVNKQVLHKLFDANRHERVEELYTLLRDGVYVVVDRYLHSGRAYAVADGVDPPSEIMPDPDIVYYLKADPSQLAYRSGYGDHVTETLDYQKRVHSAFEKLVERNWCVVNAERCADDIEKAVLHDVVRWRPGLAARDLGHVGVPLRGEVV